MNHTLTQWQPIDADVQKATDDESDSGEIDRGEGFEECQQINP